MKNKERSGIIAGLLSGILWGADTHYNGVILMMLPFTLVDPRLAGAALLLALFHDGFSALMMTGELVRQGQLKQTFKQLTSKSSFVVMLAAVLGGPMGMRAYLYAVDAIGAGLTASISSMYPVVAAFLGMLILKEKITKPVWIGLGLAVLAVLGVSLSGDMMQSNAQLIGFLVAFLSVVGWSLESVICSIGMKEDLNPKQALWIRQCVSTLVYLGFITFESDLVYSVTAVMSQPVLWLILGVAVLGTLSYLNFYRAIDTIGPVKATALNISYAIWAIVFSILLGGAEFNPILLLSAALMIVSSVLVSQHEGA